MSVAYETLIYCDGGEECTHDGVYCQGDCRQDSAAKQRAGFKINKWLHRNGKDFCAACAKRLFNYGDGIHG